MPNGSYGPSNPRPNRRPGILTPQTARLAQADNAPVLAVLAQLNQIMPGIIVGQQAVLQKVETGEWPEGYDVVQHNNWLLTLIAGISKSLNNKIVVAEPVVVPRKAKPDGSVKIETP